MKVEIFNHDNDGYQIIYIDGKNVGVIHFNDDLLGDTAYQIIELLGHDLTVGWHEDMPDSYREECKEYLDE